LRPLIDEFTSPEVLEEQELANIPMPYRTWVIEERNAAEAAYANAVMILRPIDINSDGHDDLMVFGGEADPKPEQLFPATSGAWRLYLSTPDNIGNWTLQRAEFDIPFNSAYAKFGDLNADGLIDVFFIADINSSYVEDIKAHYLERDPTASPDSNMPYKYSPLVTIANTSGLEPANWLPVGDVTGDGRVDFVGRFFSRVNAAAGGIPVGEPGSDGHIQQCVMTEKFGVAYLKGEGDSLEFALGTQLETWTETDGFYNHDTFIARFGGVRSNISVGVPGFLKTLTEAVDAGLNRDIARDASRAYFSPPQNSMAYQTSRAGMMDVDENNAVTQWENFSGKPNANKIHESMMVSLAYAGPHQLPNGHCINIWPSSFYQATHVNLTDINGDGILDISYGVHVTPHPNFEPYSGGVKYALGVGKNGLFTNRVLIDNESESVEMVDIDADGDKDAVWIDVAATKTYVRKWLGDRFSSSNDFFMDGAIKQFIDLDGDGEYDPVKSSSGSHDFYLGGDRSGRNRIEKVVNGLGVETTIEYEQMNSTGHYTWLGIDSNNTHKNHSVDVEGGSGSVAWSEMANFATAEQFYASLRDPFSDVGSTQQTLFTVDTPPVFDVVNTMALVTRVSASSPAAGYAPGQIDQSAKAATEYFYHRARTQPGGRGFLGFKKLTAVNTVNGIRRETRFRQDWPYIGLVDESVSYSPQNNKLTEVKNEWSLHDYQTSWPQNAQEFGTASLGALQAVNNKNTEYRYDLSGNGAQEGSVLTTTITELENDTFGNPELVTVSVNGGDSEWSQTVTDYEYLSDDWARMRGRLLNKTVIRSRGGETDWRQRTDYFYYDLASSPCSSGENNISNSRLKGLLCQEITEPGSAIELRNRYYYDEYGNRTFTHASGTHGESRLSAFTLYDERGRYPETLFNVFDPAVGAGHYMADSTYRQLAGDQGSVQISSEVIERNGFGTPTLTHQYTSPNHYTTLRSATTPFGLPYFSSDGTGGYVLSTADTAHTACPAGTAYATQQRAAGGSKSVVCHDLLGRVRREAVPGFDGSWVYTDSEYDRLGRTARHSEPYFASHADYWTDLGYDLLDRVTQMQHPFNLKSRNDGSDTGVRASSTISYSGFEKLLINPEGQKKREVQNIHGEIVSVTDDELNTARYYYDAQGNLRRMVDPAFNATEMFYDNRGRKTSMNDPDKGALNYRYNSFGDLLCQQDAKEQTITSQYDLKGRLVQRLDRLAGGDCENPTGDVTASALWQFDTAENGMGLLNFERDTISGFEKHTRYDSLGRMSTMRTVIPGFGDHYEGVTYDQYGRVYQQFDAARNDNQFDRNAVENGYNTYGYLYRVLDASRINGESVQEYYRVLNMDARGNVTQARLGAGVTETEADYYTDSGLLKSTATRDAQNRLLQAMQTRWDHLGNLVTRQETGLGVFDAHQNSMEMFVYDELNRLTGYTTTTHFGGGSTSVDYDAIGNISYKSDIGVYGYNNSGPGSIRPHAVTDAGGISYAYDDNGNLINDGRGRTFDYTPFDKVSLIRHGNGETEFDYGTGRNRYKRVDRLNSQSTTTVYIGGVEKIYYSDGRGEWKRPISGAALITHRFNSEGQPTNKTTHYLHGDHLGSINLITDDEGNAVEQMAFDPWGRRRNIEDWGNLADLSPYFKRNTPLTSSGFTGHEMVDEADIIHMNGRIYDPALGRFIQADIFIQSPTTIASLNRYSYVWNNPLNSTDPSGYQMEEVVVTGSWDSYSPGWAWDLGGSWNSGWWQDVYNGDSQWGMQVMMQAPDLSSVFNQTAQQRSVNAMSADEKQVAEAVDTALGGSVNGNDASGKFGNQENSSINYDGVLYWASLGANAAGFVSGAGEYSNVNTGQWLGKNGKWNSLIWGGNQYTGPRSEALQVADHFKVVGKIAFAAGAVISSYQGAEAIGDGRYGDAAKSGLDIGMGVVGLGGPFGLLVSGSYFVTDTFFGWDTPAKPEWMSESDWRSVRQP
jgi:RHS repeat-associated protein